MTNSPAQSPSFDSVISNHFRSLQGLIQSFFASHAGLFELQESEFKSFSAEMPGFLASRSSAMGFEDIRYRAQVSLLRTALIEMRRLNVALLEQTRRFLEIQKIAASNSTDDEKKSQFKKTLESAPTNFSDLIENVSILMQGSFRGQAELKSLFALERLLPLTIPQNNNQNGSKPSKVRLIFAQPDSVKTRPEDGKSTFRVVPIGLEIQPGAKLPIERNFVRNVSFTAYSIALNISFNFKK
jgi:hypothetical protein